MEAEFWNSKYSTEDLVYGSEPNGFFKEELVKLKPGKIFLPADGEGRNGVFAAKQGWTVDAVDFSSQARTKALTLAEQENVKLNYVVADLKSFIPENNYYDAVGVIFLHMDEPSTREFARKVIACLRPGGILIQEVYSKNQLGKESGGPQNSDLLYSADELRVYYNELNIVMLQEENIILNESRFHHGDASVLRMTGLKNK